ncbi:MAG: hypothetical protein C0501_04210 [Isosphaera sp.]|nr:hypothetical protein [Isosphaera sp.]
MSEIVLDATAAAAVAGSPTPTRVTDPAGRTVGYVMAPEAYEARRRAVLEWAKRETTNEELIRRAAEGGTKTPEDVLKLLEGA